MDDLLPSAKAGEGIEAGWGIKAGEGIKAGADYGIYAGLRLRISQKMRAVVIAATKPKNLLLGTYQAKEETGEQHQ